MYTRNAAFVIDADTTARTTEEAVDSVATPKIVTDILATRTVLDSHTRLQGRPRVMRLGDVPEVIAAIADVKRQVAVTVATSPGEADDETWREVVEELTFDTRGVAGTFVITNQAAEDLNRLLPEHLRVPRGHVRTFSPHVDFANKDDQVRHLMVGPEVLDSALDGSRRLPSTLIRAHARGPRT